MAYFLKQSRNNKGVYLQIYDSFYDPDKKTTAHKSFKALGYVHQFQEQGIEDPIAHFKLEVNKLNQERKLKQDSQSVAKIGEPVNFYLGFFPLKNVYNTLRVEPLLDIFQTTRDFRFSISKLLEALIYARATKPCSKYKTFTSVIPQLLGDYDFSYEQILDGINFLGSEYKKIIELFTVATEDYFSIDTSETYFDCTNFYFEIDREDDFRKKGPLKENRRDPLVGMGLLLDKKQIPIGMELFPGNESERPKLPEILKSLKARNNIKGRTIQVADKGLNCSQNILEARRNKDGYLFSKSVKMLPQKELDWVLSPKDYLAHKDIHGQILYYSKSCVDKFPYTYVDEDGKKHTLMLTEKRLITFNEKLARKKQAELKKQIDKAANLCLSQAKREEFGDLGKYLCFTSSQSGKTKDVKAELNYAAIQKDMDLAGFNMLVTSEIEMDDREIYKVYHNLWKIEESFRIMKSELDARPVYLQKEDSIKGHFLICYLTVLLERILQNHIFEDALSASELFEFFRSFKLAKTSKYRYLNLTAPNQNLNFIAEKLLWPLDNLYFADSEVKRMLNGKFSTTNMV